MKHALAISATLTAAAIALSISFVADSLTSQTIAAGGDRGDRVAVTENECKAATWPNIPQSCLERVAPRGSLHEAGAGLKAG